MSISDVDADPVVVLPAHQILLCGGRLINYEHKLRRKDSTIITVLNNSRSLTDIQGNVVGMLSTLIEITERKLVEEELHKYRDHLEELVKERTAQLNQKNEELERFNKLFVGRELRMIELKKKIAELEKSTCKEEKSG